MCFRQKDSGVNALFSEEFNFKLPAAAALNDGTITVKVYNKSLTGSKTPVGNGFAFIKDIIPSLNAKSYVKIDISQENFPSGFVLFQANLTTGGKIEKFPEKPVPTAKAGSESKKDSKDPSKATGKFNPKDFTAGILKVDEIHCENLLNVEIFGGKNDPYILLSVGPKQHKSDTIEEGGSENVKFEHLNFDFDVTKDSLENDKLSVVVMDRNTKIRSDVLIGEASIDMTSLMNHINEENFPIPLTISNPKKPRESTGEVVIFVHLVPIQEIQKKILKPEQIKEYISNFHVGELQIVSARAHQLPSTKNEKFFFTMQFEKYKDKSTTIDMNSQGSRLPIFENLNMNYEINFSQLENNSEMELELFHPAWLGFSTASLGKGKIGLKNFLISQEVLDGKPTEITIDLLQPKGSSGGKFVLTFKLLSEALRKQQELKSCLQLPKDFDKGKLRIVKINANGLKNTEYTGRQDPYIILEHRDWKTQTKTLDDAGNDAEWENLDIQLVNLSKKELSSLEEEEQIQIRVLDENTGRDDALIGTAQLSIMKSIQEINKEFTFTTNIYLNEKDRESHKPSGRITFQAILLPFDENELQNDKLIPKDIPKAFLEISKIVGSELTTGNFAFPVYPQIEIKYNNLSQPEDAFTFITVPKPESGKNPHWINLNLLSKDFDTKQFLTESMVVNLVENETKVVSTATIVNLREAFIHAREEVPLKVEFFHASNKTKSLGKCSIYLKVTPSTERKDTIHEEVVKNNAIILDRPLEFEVGEIFIKKITLKNLKNKEAFGGKSDPFVLIQYKEWIGQTEVLENSGEEVIYDDLDLHAEVIAEEVKESFKNLALAPPIEEVVQQEEKSAKSSKKSSSKKLVPSASTNNDPVLNLEISVFDKNKYLKNALIGKAIIPIRRFVFAVNEELPVEMDIRDMETHQKNGSITLVAELKKVDTSNIPKLPSTLNNVLVEISKISTFELKNLEFWGDKQDPTLTVKIKEAEIGQTPVIKDGGSDVIFDLLDIKGLVPLKSFTKEIITIDAYDYETAGKPKFIGSGSVSLRPCNTLNKEYQLPIRLINKNKDYSGRALVFLKLKDGKDYDPGTLNEKEETTLKPLPKDFKKGIFSVKKIVTKGLISVTRFTTQNPFVEVSLNSWKDQTLPYNEMNVESDKKFMGGKDCLFNLVDLSCMVDASIIEREELTVTVKNKGVNTDFIGTGKCRIYKTVNHYEEEEEVKLEVLLYDDKKKDKVNGKIILFTKFEILSDEELENDIPIKESDIPKDFQFGNLKIDKIECFNLKNTEFVGKQDPFVMLKYSDIFNEQTNAQDNAGQQAQWDHLPFEFQVLRENLLENLPLEVTVMDENSLRPNALIGKASLTLRKSVKNMNRDLILSLLLFDSKNSLSGKCKLYCSFTAQDPSVALPDNIANGNLLIKRITMFGFKEKEFMAMTKIDPFVAGKCSSNNFTFKTIVKDNAGGTADWDALDYDMLCDAKTLRGGLLELEVFTGKTLLGTGTVNIKDFYKPAKEKEKGKAEKESKKEGKSSGKGGKGKEEEVETVEPKTPVSTDKDVICTISNAKGPAGKLTIQGKLLFEKQFVAPTLDLPKDFVVGKILFHHLEAAHLKNTEWAGKQDPYARLSISDIWSETTSTLNNAGSHPVWPTMDLVAEVNRNDLANEKLRIDFFDQNFSRNDVPLGSGTVSLRSLCAKINTDVPLEIDLIDDKKAIISKCTVTGKLIQGDIKDAFDSLPDSMVKIEKGVLQILEINAYDLKSGQSESMVDTEDPYCLVEVGSENCRTNTLDNAGRSCSWKELDNMSMLVNRSMLLDQKLKVTILDKNGSVRKDSFMGKGEISLRKLGSLPHESIETYTIRMKDTRQRASGRIEIKMVLHPVIEDDAKAVGVVVNEDGTTAATGKLQIYQIKFEEVTNNVVAYGKQDVLGRVTILPNWKQPLPLLKGAGSSGTWTNLNLETAKFSKQHLQKEGVKVEIISKSATGETVVGIAKLPLGMALNTPNEVQTIPAQFSFPNDNKKYAGKCLVQARYVISNTDETKLTGPTIQADRDLSDIQNKLHSLEGALKKQLLAELTKDRNAMMESLENQNKELRSSMDAMMKKLNKMMEKRETEEVPHGDMDAPAPMVYEVKDLKLPKDVSRWKTVHVLAWLTCDLGLPQYLDAFNEASIDGLMLLNDHVTHKTLKDYLNIENEKHRSKILINIEQLKLKYQKYLELLEQKKREKEEAERKRREKEEADRLKREQEKKKKTKSKPKTMSKPDFIENGLNRVILEKSLKDQTEKQKALRRKKESEFNRLNKTWQFEYTGKPPPNEEEMMKGDTVWNTMTGLHDNKNPAIGTKNYQNTMKSLLKSDDITNIPINREVRDIPKTCSTDDVVAIVKGAMFEVSNLLLKLEESNYQKQFLLDYDLIGDQSYDVNDNDDEEEEEEEQENEKGVVEQKPKGEAIKTKPRDDDLPSFDECLKDTEPDSQSKPINNSKISNTVTKKAGKVPKLGITQEHETPPDWNEFFPEKEAPPAWDDFFPAEKKEEKLDLSSPVHGEDHSEDNLQLTIPSQSPPPAIKPSEKTTSLAIQGSKKSLSKKKKDLTNSLIQSKALLASYDPANPPFETGRMKLIFNSFIAQTNNHANWLGPNQKLTRLKLEGGIENILKLRLSWEQFDMLWNRLDYKRSGDIDYNEFEKFFGNLNEFLVHEGMSNLSLSASQKVGNMMGTNNNTYFMTQTGPGGKPLAGTTSMVGGAVNNEMKLLVDYLYQFCDVLRKTSHFTVIDIFNSFDRNGSGDVSLSEFCSLLRLVISASSPQGNLNFDKKMVYKALNVLDIDGNKSISLHELLLFIYRIWKTQLTDLAGEIRELNKGYADDMNATTNANTQEMKKKNTKRNELIQNFYQEREDIKAAIKRNYPRQWRDKFESESSSIPGPFTNLMNQLGIHTVDTFNNPDSPEKTLTLSKTNNASSQESLYVEETMAPFSPNRGNANKTNLLSTSSPNKKPGRTYLSGHNTLLRFKIKVPAGVPPFRTATHNHQPMKLTLPTVKTLDNADIMTGETTNKVLHEFDYLNGTYN
jgi:hypothetical protein